MCLSRSAASQFGCFSQMQQPNTVADNSCGLSLSPLHRFPPSRSSTTATRPTSTVDSAKPGWFSCDTRHLTLSCTHRLQRFRFLRHFYFIYFLCSILLLTTLITIIDDQQLTTADYDFYYGFRHSFAVNTTAANRTVSPSLCPPAIVAFACFNVCGNLSYSRSHSELPIFLGCWFNIRSFANTRRIYQEIDKIASLKVGSGRRSRGVDRRICIWRCVSTFFFFDDLQIEFHLEIS